MRPFVKGSRWFTMDISSSTAPITGPDMDFIHPNAQNSNRAPKLMTAATIWFSVMDEVNIPRAIKLEPRSIIPIYPEMTTPQSRVAKISRIAIYGRVPSTIIKSTVNVAKNLPMSVATSERG